MCVCVVLHIVGRPTNACYMLESVSSATFVAQVVVSRFRSLCGDYVGTLLYWVVAECNVERKPERFFSIEEERVNHKGVWDSVLHWVSSEAANGHAVSSGRE